MHTVKFWRGLAFGGLFAAVVTVAGLALSDPLAAWWSSWTFTP